jgi:hypothetical protein
METNKIPSGWWLNVTIMARFQDSWIVGIMRKGKASWITECVLKDFETSEEAYEAGMKWINKYLESKNK